MKTLVSNLGFDADHILRALVDHDIEGRDGILLFRPERDDPRGNGAIEEIEGVTEKMYGNLQVEVEFVDPRDFESAVVSIKRSIDQSSGDIILNLSGGDRALLVAITVASMYLSKDIEGVSTFSDAFLERIPVSMPTVERGMEESDRRILEALKEGAETCSEVSKRIGLSPSSVSRRMERLEDNGYLKREVEGNKRPADLTFKGKLTI